MKKWYGTNLKMYKTPSEVHTYLSELDEIAKERDFQKMNLFVIPPYTALQQAKEVLRIAKEGETPSPILLGAQNMAYEEEGQFTGEISARMLKELGVSLVMVGHSERRHVFNEGDQELNKKVLLGIQHGFKMLLCIGETKEEKDYGISDETLRKQIKIGLFGVKKENLNMMLLAYEPVWAIGKDGVPATKEYIEEKHKVIKDTLVELYGKEGADVPLFYGGSVNHGNAVEIDACNNVDGLFVGRSAWKASDFEKIMKMTE